MYQHDGSSHFLVETGPLLHRFLGFLRPMEPSFTWPVFTENRHGSRLGCSQLWTSYTYFEELMLASDGNKLVFDIWQIFTVCPVHVSAEPDARDGGGCGGCGPDLSLNLLVLLPSGVHHLPHPGRREAAWDTDQVSALLCIPKRPGRGRPQSIHSETGSGLFTKCLPSSGRKLLPARWFSFFFFFQLFLGAWFGNSKGLWVSRSGRSPP